MKTNPRILLPLTIYLVLVGCGKSDSDVATTNTDASSNLEMQNDLVLFKKHGYASEEAVLKRGGFLDISDAKERLTSGFPTRAAYEESLLANVKKQYEANGNVALYGTDSCRLARSDYAKARRVRDEKWDKHWQETLSTYCLTGEFDPDVFYSTTYLPAETDKCRNRPAFEPSAAYVEMYEYFAMRIYFNLLDALSPRKTFYQNVDLTHVHELNLKAEDNFCPNGNATKAFKELSLIDQPKKQSGDLENFKKTAKSIASAAGVTSNQQLVALRSTATIEMITPVSGGGVYRFLISMKPIIHQGHQGEPQVFYPGGPQCRYRFNNLPSKDVFDFTTTSEDAARKIEKIIRRESTTASQIRSIDLRQYQGIFYDENELMVTIFAIVDELEADSCTVVLKAQAIEIATVDPQDPIHGKSERIVLEKI